jgi:hypothetical protein
MSGVPPGLAHAHVDLADRDQEFSYGMVIDLYTDSTMITRNAVPC